MADTIRCSACGALNFWNAAHCERCHQSLSDERNREHALRRTQQLPAPRGAGRADLDDPGFEPRGGADDEGLDPAPLDLRPDPLFGPLLRRFTLYRLDRETLRIRSGIVAQRWTQLEWWRVGTAGADVKASAGPLQRLRGTGNIYITSNDPDTPRVVLRDYERITRLIQHTARAQQMRRARWNIGPDFNPAIAGG